MKEINDDEFMDDDFIDDYDYPNYGKGYDDDNYLMSVTTIPIDTDDYIEVYTTDWYPIDDDFSSDGEGLRMDEGYYGDEDE